MQSIIFTRGLPGSGKSRVELHFDLQGRPEWIGEVREVDMEGSEGEQVEIPEAFRC